MKKKQVTRFWKDLEESTEIEAVLRKYKSYGGRRTLQRYVQADRSFKSGLSIERVGQQTGWSDSYVRKIYSWWEAPLGTDDIELAPRPQLDVSLEGLWPVISGATVLSLGGYRPIDQAGQPTLPVTVIAYRFKVSNDGKGAAEHVAGTLEFDSIERRICWYEGNVPYIDINEHDHSYLNVYGVILNPQNSPTTDIVMPTEHGWDNLYPRTLEAPLEVSLRVTAANARPQTTRFSIDPTQGCRPIGR